MSAGPTVDPRTLWDRLLDILLHETTSDAQQRWLSATETVGFSADTLVLAAPHDFARDWIDANLGTRITDLASRDADRPITLLVTVQPDPEPFDEEPEPAPSAGASYPTPLPPRQGRHRDLDELADGDEAIADGSDLLPRIGPVVERPVRPIGQADPEQSRTLTAKYQFDDFVIGPSNRFANAAARAVAEAPAKSYNPLFIYGGSGLGKTHLLHAIGNYVRENYPRLRVEYVTSEDFTNEFIAAISNRSVSAFQGRYRRSDVLLVDDIQFLEGKERTQEEFFHTFNTLHNAEKQIVMTSDRAPKQISQLEDRLRSRFEWGLITDVQPPDLETRIAILTKKAQADELTVSPDTLELIASKVDSNIRELEGALIRIAAYASLHGNPPDASMAETVLRDVFPEGGSRQITAQLVMDEVAHHFALSEEELCSPSRTRSLVQARQIAMYLVRELTELSLPKIGEAFGGRDHTTVLHANKKIAQLMQEKHDVYETVQSLTNRIRTEARTS
ncbi:MAG: chromosomal replication initiator protein DnaA [Nitriliruptorales bacterium]|nr:chromosomal replication initiator protein DnaA [Nitriliruptorales bacterium]